MRYLLVPALVVGLLSSTPLSAQPQAVTLDKLTEYLTLGVPEAKLLKLVADSPTVFVLGQAEEAALRNAGATDSLIAAIKGKVAAFPQTGDVRAFVVILDVSGSMADKDASGTPKWGAAQKAAVDLVTAVPDGRQLAFIVYGHDAKRECQAVDVVQALAPVDAGMKERLKGYIGRLKPAGHTPIALSLTMAGAELRKAEGLSKVVLITDGLETCHGDPNKEAAELAKIDTFRGVDVVGLGLKADESAGVAGIAQAGKGRFYDAKTAADLTRSVAAIAVAIQQPVRPDGRPALSPLEQALVDQLKSADWRVREGACQGLAGRKSTAAAPWVGDFLACELYDNPPGLMYEKSRDAALAYMKAFGKPHLDDALVRGMKSPNYQVRGWCALAAGTVAPAVGGDRSGLAALDQAMVGLLGDEAWPVRKAACEGLRGRKCRAAAPAVADFLAGDLYNTPPGIVREKSRDAAVDYFKAVAPEQLEAALARALHSSKPEVRAWAGKAAADISKMK